MAVLEPSLNAVGKKGSEQQCVSHDIAWDISERGHSWSVIESSLRCGGSGCGGHTAGSVEVIPPFPITRCHQFPEGQEDVIVSEEVTLFFLNDICRGLFPFP